MFPLDVVKTECTCDCCQDACRRKPGWFAPGEVEQAAGLLGLSVQEFFGQYLAVDFWMASALDGPVFVLAPANSNNPAGQEYRFNPLGQCVFYQQGRCLIHAAKPLECALYLHTDSKDDLAQRKAELVLLWRQSKEAEHLLGRPPVPARPTDEDLFTMHPLFSMFGDE